MSRSPSRLRIPSHARLPALARHGSRVLSVVCAVVVLTPTAAHAAGAEAAVPNDLPTVIANLRLWVMGIIAAIATLYAVRAALYWTTAGGDPAQVDKAKGALRDALLGYALAVLSPVLLEIVQGIVWTPR